MREFVKLVPTLDRLMSVDVLTAVNLYQTSYVTGPVQAPKGAVESVAAAMVPGTLSQLLLIGRLMALAQLSL